MSVLQRESSTRRRKNLGQHMLISEETAIEIVKISEIRKGDTVFEIGTGRGLLTLHLAQRATKVITCDLDSHLLEEAKSRLKGFANITFLRGNAFVPPICKTRFDVCVTSLPYSRSREFIEWLAFANKRRFRSCTAVVQSEFAHKLVALPGREEYRFVSVLAQILFGIEIVKGISRYDFDPVPGVSSSIIRLVPRNDSGLDSFASAHARLLRNIFSFRGRLLRSAVRKTPELMKCSRELREEWQNRRVEQLQPQEILSILELACSPK